MTREIFINANRELFSVVEIIIYKENICHCVISCEVL